VYEIEANPISLAAPRETKVVIVGSINCAASYVNSCLEATLDPTKKPQKSQNTSAKINNQPNVYFAETEAPGRVSNLLSSSVK
jgi:hypothetical protein